MIVTLPLRGMIFSLDFRRLYMTYRNVQKDVAHAYVGKVILDYSMYFEKKKRKKKCSVLNILNF